MTGSGGDQSGHAVRLREAYVDASSLDSRAEHWMEALEPYTRHRFERGRLAGKPLLMVMDMQRFFLEAGAPGYLPASAAIVPKVRELMEVFGRRGLPVIFTRHVDRPGDADGPMGRWWKNLMSSEDPLTDLDDSFSSGSRDMVFVKQHYSAFQGTRLEVLLNRLRVNTLIITGVMTHLCCESTARDAFMRGFNVIAVVDGMATLNEELHLASLRTLVHGFAVPVRANDLTFGLNA